MKVVDTIIEILIVAGLSFGIMTDDYGLAVACFSFFILMKISSLL